MQFRHALPTLGAGTAALALVALTAGPAAAHVTVTPSTTAAGAHAVLTFSVGHGCEASPTTRLTISMPEEIPAVTPTVNPGWTIEKVDEELTEPITDAHGNQITDRVSEVVYTAKQPLADGFRDTVELSVQLPDAAGETLAFPVVQTCVEGETGWIETAADGQDAEALESPAPTLTITEGGAAHGADTDTDRADTESDADTNADAADEDGSSNALAITGIATGVVGILIGALAMARTRKA